MTHFYSFAVLHAMPDHTRDERVNVGIVIATPNGLDVRTPELRKLRILTGHEWQDIISAYTKRLEHEWARCGDLATLREQLGSLSEIFTLSNLGSLVAGPKNYEERVAAILRTYVDKPRLSRSERQQKINSEIARALKNAGVLFEKGETIDDHKVVTKYIISREKEMVADFAYKNGVMKIVSTLDLRSSKSAHSRACEKGATLFFAKEKFGPSTKPFGVYAVPPSEADSRKSEIEILAGFADGNIYNWLSMDDRQKFSHNFY